MKRLLFPLVLAVLVAPCAADSLTYMRVHRQLMEEQLKVAHDGEAGRIRAVRGLLQKSGCSQVIEQAVPKEEFPNLICLLPGQEDGTIIVSASSDYPEDQTQTSASWGSLALLPILAESLALVPHRFTVMLVAFTGHEHGMRGAKWYLSQLTEAQRKPIQAMISLDNIGNTPPVYALAQPDTTLAKWLQVAAVSLQLPTPPVVDATTVDQSLQNGQLTVRDEDLWSEAKAFEHEHIPAIALQSASPAMLSKLHRSGAIPDAVTGTTFDIDAFENAYRLLAVYILYLDRNLGRPLVEPGIYSGQLIDTAGVFSTSPLDISVKLDRFSSSTDLIRYERILHEGGQDALAEALSDENARGTYRFGLNLAYAVKVATLHESGKTPAVFLVGTRVKPPASTSRDFRFTVIKLSLDGNGAGTGSFYNSVKLRFNKKHELEIEDFNSIPDDIRQVRLDKPKFPVATQSTMVAAAPANVPPAGNSTPTAQPVSVASSANAATPPTAIPQKTSEATASPAAGSTLASASIPTEANVPRASSTPDASVATFKTQAQLVQLDVSVTDSSGRPISGLQQTDFTVLENGQPQEIRAFEPHLPNTVQAAKSAAAPKLSLPPNTFTNRVAAPPEGPLSILLLDLWNTPLNDQAYARKQTIEFLKGLPPGKTIAMYVLGNKLTLVQGFSDDPATLVASAERVMNERSLLLRTDGERQQFQGAADNVGRNAMPTIAGAPAGAVGNLQSGSLDFGHAQARQRTDAMLEADRTAERVFTTLDALSSLARSVSSYPGRKNLVWLSGSFPIRLKPSAAGLLQLNSGSFAPTSGLDTAPNFPAALRVATRALATARIAVYPIDVRGVQMSGVDIAVSASESASLTGTDKPGAFGQNLNTQSAQRFEDRSSMKEVAEQTGGEVLAGNDVRAAIGRAIDDGATYYAIAYTPAKIDTSPEFRKIEVKLNRPGLKLAYRPGYFPNGSPAGEPPKAHPLIVAMQPGVPPSTVVPLTAVVLAPDAANKKTRLTYTIDIRGMDFSDAPEHGKRAVIDCIAVAFTKQGVPVGQASNTVDATLPPSDYLSALNNGLVVPQELDLPPGEYVLRLGVMDHGSQKIGTLDAPLVIAR
jgi:VWFA-related protein